MRILLDPTQTFTQETFFGRLVFLLQKCAFSSAVINEWVTVKYYFMTSSPTICLFSHPKNVYSWIEIRIIQFKKSNATVFSFLMKLSYEKIHIGLDHFNKRNSLCFILPKNKLFSQILCLFWKTKNFSTAYFYIQYSVWDRSY